MKKRRWMILPSVLFLFVGCGGISNADASLISVDKDGTIDTMIVESFEEEYYDKEELQQNIEEAIDTYNQQTGGEVIELKSCKIRKETARVHITYDNYQAYTDFNQIPMFNGSIADAITAGFGTEENLTKTDENLVTTLQELADAKDTYRVAVVKEPIQIETSGDIVYVSSNVTVDEKRLATAREAQEVVSAVVENEEAESTDTEGETASQKSSSTVLNEYAYIVYES